MTEAHRKQGGDAHLKALIVSDIHSNLEAFSSVIEDSQRRGGFDEIWSLGDLVGYGPDPAAVIDLLRGYPHKAVAGNHDLACVGEIDLEMFNPIAAAANRWTAEMLDADRRDFLRERPLTIEAGEFTLVHGSPRDPIWEYVLTESAIRAALNYIETDWCLVGHTHIPFLCRQRRGIWGELDLIAPPRYGEPNPLGSERTLVNPGGVGQPRDGDARAAYALFDSDESAITHCRAEYDIAATQRKMRFAELPEPLIQRLPLGR